ncbi:MAG: hypothetical protein KGJ90_07120, partial [Patescibacteria group bacterium]|nr:hypothetical protein [Patescibacteria group bacterium]
SIFLNGLNGSGNGINFTGYGTGVLLSGANGNITSGTVNLASSSYVSGILGSVNGGSPFDIGNGSIFERNNTLDLLLGATGTSSSKFAFINVNSGTPTASISANNGNNSTYLSGNGTLGTTNFQNLTLGGSTTGNITLNPLNGSGLITFAGTSSFTSGTGLTTVSGNLLASGTASVSGGLTLFGTPTIGTTSLQSLILGGSTTGNIILGQNTGTSTVVVAPNAGGQSSLIINNLGSGDLLTASKSGTTQFNVLSNGNIQFTGNSTFLNTFTSAATANQTISIPNLSGQPGQTDTPCFLSLGNCIGGANGAVGGGGTLNYIAKFSPDGSHVANSQIFDNGTKIGIGTGSPLAYVDIQGGTSGGNSAVIINQTGASTNDIFSASSSGTPQFTVTNNGQIKFTGGSGFTLTLASTASANYTYILPNIVGDTQANICLTSGNCSGVGGGVTTSGGDQNRIAKFTGTQSLGDSSINDLYNGVAMTIDSSGNIGIGTTNPLALLDVNGTASVSGAITLFGTPTIQSTSFQNLTLGGTTTGSIFLNGLNGSGNGINFTGYGTGVIISSASGNLISSKIDLSSSSYVANVLGIGNGGTGTSSTPSQGTLLIGNASNGYSVANLSAGFGITIANGDGSITIGSNQGTNWFTENAGLIYPTNSTLDFALGGTSTSSSKFAVINVNSGTPTASISANNGNNSTYLSGNGTLGTTNFQNLTIGSPTTGQVILSGRNGA